jgi:hypothetical protein
MENLLIHSCSYSAPAEIDRDGEITYGEAVTLEHVRIVPVLATAKSDVGETKDDKLTLYYAPAISTPAIIPEELARVTWGGKAYTIRSVQPCYTQGGETIHHYEAALI